MPVLNCVTGLSFAQILKDLGEGIVASRFDQLIHLSRETSLTIDYLEKLTSGLDSIALAILCGNASKLPKIMKSIESPNVSRRRMQLSNDGR